jgi:hypothetical protein
MKTYRIAFSLIAALAFALAGCQSGFQARQQEKSAAFSAANASTQARLQKGIINVSDSADFVYIALGKPSSQTSRETPQGKVDTWVYRNFVFGPDMVVKLSNNNPGVRYQNHIYSPNMNRDGPSLSSTKQAGPRASLDSMGGSAVGTLYVDFIDNAVVGLHSDQ